MSARPGWMMWTGLGGYVIHLWPAQSSTGPRPDRALCGTGCLLRIWCRDLTDPDLVDLAGIERARNGRVCARCKYELDAGSGKGHPSHQAGTR